MWDSLKKRNQVQSLTFPFNMGNPLTDSEARRIIKEYKNDSFGEIVDIIKSGDYENFYYTVNEFETHYVTCSFLIEEGVVIKRNLIDVFQKGGAKENALNSVCSMANRIR